MIFKSVEIQNFMSIKTASIDLDKQGLVLIQGVNEDNPSFMSNGAGKSTIIESLVYVLFGRTLRGVKGDDVVSKVAGKNCKVMLDIIDDDGTQYRIARYRKHHHNKNSVFLYCNGTDVTPKSEADFTKKVIELLQTDFMTFTSSILYSAESFKFTQATDSELKSAFDIMLDLKIYSDCQEEIKAQLRELTAKKQKLSSKISEIDHRKAVLEDSKRDTQELAVKYESEKEEKIESIMESIEELEDKKASVDDELSEIMEEMEQIQAEIDGLKSKKKKSSGTQEALESLRETIEEYKDEKADVRSKIRKTNSYIQQLTDDILDNERAIANSQKKISKYKTHLEELKNTVGTPCPTCGKPLDEDHIVDAVKECNSQIESENSKIKINNTAIEDFRQLIKKQERDLTKLNSELEDIDCKLTECELLLEKVQEKLKGAQEIESKILDKERQYNRVEKRYNEKKLSKDSYDSKIKLYESQVEQLSEEENPYNKQISEFDAKISRLNPEYEVIQEEEESLHNEEEILNFWLQGFSNSGIKSMLLDDITPFLNKRANKYLKALSGEHLSVNFTTQTKLKSGELREKFQIELINEDGGNSYMSNSSGEKRRVDVAINLALCDLIASRANKKINITFMDEIFDTLDTSGIDSVMGLLRAMSEEKSSIFVISHNEQIQSYFDRTLTVTKKDGCSTVVFEG